ncbi:MAG: cytochrome c biogenesis protein CcdA [Alphaproteobacteria bacterium]|nr:cytochrome c biogenesis protein CcdA [Alphaproteobacteria bacterium]
MDGGALLGFVAGILSTLSPCVLPLLPLVLGAAAAEHRWAPAALAAGVALSFTLLGTFVAVIGFAVGLDGDVFRTVAAAMMIAIGVVLMTPMLQTRLAAAGGPVSDWASRRLGGFDTSGLGGQLALGLLLGAVWSPCVGPTLGAASLLAAKGESLGRVALVMASFGIGAAVPLLALGMLSRDAMMRWRGRLLATGKGVKVILGGLLAAVGLLVLLGLDKRIEAMLVSLSPDWLTALTTRF